MTETIMRPMLGWGSEPQPGDGLIDNYLHSAQRLGASGGASGTDIRLSTSALLTLVAYPFAVAVLLYAYPTPRISIASSGFLVASIPQVGFGDRTFEGDLKRPSSTD
jgi:hypothetical protein